MHVLEHAPVALLSGLLKHDVGVFFLTLTHRNVGESTSIDRLVVSETNLFHVGSWVDTREQHEEDCSLRLCLSVKIEHIKGRLLDKFKSEPLRYVLNQCARQSIRSHRSQEE